MPRVLTPKSKAGEPEPGPSDRNLERIAWLMDRALVIPGTNVRVGLDAMIGLIPVGGDVLTGIVQVALVLYVLAYYRVPKVVAARMISNVLLDVGLGSVPLVGDVFDVFFKANTRNLKLLRDIQRHQARGEPVPSAPSARYLLLVGAGLGAALVLVLIGFIALIVWASRAAGRGPW